MVIAGILMIGCTPKSTEQAQTTPPKPGKPQTTADPCATFKDSKAGEAALDAHVIYRDLIKREQFREAIPYWRQAFKAAPAADGQRTTHFDDGVKIYDYLLMQENSVAKKKIYLDSVLYMYDRLSACYPENQYIDGRKAFDLYYNYKELADKQTIFDLFTSVIDQEGLETPAFVINPFTALLVEMFNAGDVDTITAAAYAKQILAITDKHAELIESAPCDMSVKYEKTSAGQCTGVDANGTKTAVDALCCELADDIREGWPTVIGYAPQQLEAFESVKGFYPCTYYKEKYFDSVDLSSVACDDLPLITAKLNWGNCAKTDAAFARIEAEQLKRCISTETELLLQARDALKEGRYQEAVTLYKEYISTSENPEKRGKYNLLVAKIYYAHLRNFPKSREHARLALRDQPNLGEAYMVIGKLYASSGPLCGPGRGWDSQIVTWPAIDMFEKARSVDSSVVNEASRLIREYSKYMPSVEDIFQRPGINEGDSFFVGCWIQENTTIRAAR
jgi:tetratricopeptide (TPR) repeat protein